MDDSKLIQEIHDLDADSPTLAPAELVAGAKRRRAGRYAVTACASLAVAGIAITGFATKGPAGTPVAGGPDPAPNVPTTAAAQDGHSVAKAKPGKRKWTPGGPIGARPVGVIPVKGQVQLAPGVRFETKGTKWCISHWDDLTKGYFEHFGCRGTVGNANIGDGRSPGLQSSGGATSSVFRGMPRRVIYTEGGKYYEGRVYRLKGIAGWSLSFIQFPETAGEKMPERGVFTYDENNRLIASFPESKTDPLHQK
ncbi:hypothetical protein OG394_24195 [Kribbella sp. NBC_01245]|uniref:hypothetical protein n=1 Tax=Kribbella sp. NBC_01245 TaxID=2903578 RepID=UPI002E2B8CC5|nr:hypothetical protein [Kribbella sp. NBC_01245]